MSHSCRRVPVFDVMDGDSVHERFLDRKHAEAYLEHNAGILNKPYPHIVERVADVIVSVTGRPPLAIW